MNGTVRIFPAAVLHTVLAAALVLGLSLPVAGELRAGMLGDAATGGMAGRRNDGLRGFFLPGVVPPSPQSGERLVSSPPPPERIWPAAADRKGPSTLGWIDRQKASYGTGWER